MRVRGVQGEVADEAVAGQHCPIGRTAVGDLSRGMMLAFPDTFRTTRRIDVSLSLLPSAKPLKDRARVHLHAHTSETIAEVVLHEGDAVKPGESAYTQLRLSEPAFLVPGDRFIVRQFSPVVTIGGGAVLDATPLPRSCKDTVLPFLKILDSGQRESAVRMRIARRGHDGLSLAELTAETGRRGDFLRTLLAEPLRQQRILQLGERYVGAPALDALKLFLLTTVEAFHKNNPLVPGMGKEELRETVRATRKFWARRSICW